MEADRGLRDVVLATFSAHPELLDEEGTHKLLDHVESLARDLLLYLRQRAKQGVFGNAFIDRFR